MINRDDIRPLGETEYMIRERCLAILLTARPHMHQRRADLSAFRQASVSSTAIVGNRTRFVLCVADTARKTPFPGWHAGCCSCFDHAATAKGTAS
jgi:hypothetical protein